MAISLLTLAAIPYAVLATAYWEARRRREPPPRWARAAGAPAAAIHLLGLVLLALAAGRSPFHSGSEAASFLGFSLALLYLVLERTSRVATHGGAFWGTAALLAAAAVPGLVAAGPEGAEPRDALGTIHIGLALFGCAAVLAGGLLAVGYLSAYAAVKRGVPDPGATGPSLSGFERLERGASLLGLGFLGPALALGLRSAAEREASEGTAAIAAATALLFLLVAAAAFLWWRRPRRGRAAAWLNLAGTAVAIVAFAVVHPAVVG